MFTMQKIKKKHLVIEMNDDDHSRFKSMCAIYGISMQKVMSDFIKCFLMGKKE